MGDIIFWADIQNLLHKLCIAFHLSLIPGFRLLLDLSFKNKSRSSFQKLFLLQLPSDKKIVAKTNKVFRQAFYVMQLPIYHTTFKARGSGIVGKEDRKI